MKTKSGLDLSMPLGAMLLGLESAFGCAFLLLLSTVGAVAWGLVCGESLPDGQVPLLITISYDQESVIFGFLITFLFGFFSVGGFAMFMGALTGMMLFLKSSTLRLDGLLLLSFCSFLGGLKTSMVFYDTRFAFTLPVLLTLVPLFLILLLFRGLWIYGLIRSRKMSTADDEIEFD